MEREMERKMEREMEGEMEREMERGRKAEAEAEGERHPHSEHNSFTRPHHHSCSKHQPEDVFEAAARGRGPQGSPIPTVCEDLPKLIQSNIV
uniref:Uncharacterized protein n=1 Tax=Knipowitschia caucasica TaxID=637954 RepID=A0AAV2LV61_KNICA